MKVLILIGMLYSVFACSKENTSAVVSSLPVDTARHSPSDTSKTYLALGDSYTIGQSVTESERFPAQTVALLRQQGIKLADPVYIAQTGWTTRSLQNAINTGQPPTFDVVSLLIGVNDQYQHMDTSGYAERFTQLLQKAIALAKGKRTNVFVLSIPDYSATPFVAASDKQRVRTEIDWFNAINKRITAEHNVNYTDITPSTREAETNPLLVARDGLHPSGQEYKKWAAMLAPKVKAVLQ